MNFTCSAWFERDRKQLVLNMGSLEVLTLNDEEVDEAIESGFLCTPSKPRPSEEDWLQPLLLYAQDTGAMEAFKGGLKPHQRDAIQFAQWYDQHGHWMHESRREAIEVWAKWGIKNLPKHSQEAESFLSDWIDQK